MWLVKTAADMRRGKANRQLGKVIDRRGFEWFISVSNGWQERVYAGSYWKGVYCCEVRARAGRSFVVGPGLFLSISFASQQYHLPVPIPEQCWITSPRTIAVMHRVRRARCSHVLPFGALQ